MKKIYVIFKYVEDGFPTPEVFFSEDECNARFKKLVSELEENPDGEAYIDMETREASLLCEDTIYQVVEETIDENAQCVYAFCEMSNDKYFRMGRLAVSESKDVVCDIMNEFVTSAYEALAENKAYMSQYATNLDVKLDPYGEEWYANFYTEGGKYGSVQYAAKACKVQLKKQ